MQIYSTSEVNYVDTSGVDLIWYTNYLSTMKTYLKEIKFTSIEKTYLKDITPEIIKAVKKTKIKCGFIFVNTTHTTLGIVINEIAEQNLLEDIVNHVLTHVPEDKRSTWCKDGTYPHPTHDYKHRCMDSPLRDPDEIDNDYNAGRHLRSLLYSHPSVVVAIRDGKLELGKYQQIAIFEFDGRDGKGKNPIRQRTVQIWIHPTDGIEQLK